MMIHIMHCVTASVFCCCFLCAHRRSVVIPPVENLCLRSACIIGYCGFSCKAEDRPLGCTREQTCACCQQQNGCQVLTGKVPKRACCSFTQLQQVLSCEAEGAGAGEFIVTENSCKGLSCCCCEFGNAAKASCCPTPITCCGQQGQCCCLYYRGNFPCDRFAPCEFGCCSIMCVDKKQAIMDAESADRERVSGGAIEATVVEKGGAPVLAEEMTR
jgi:hypothetical protein